MEALLTRSGSSHTILLTSFRRSGQGVSTPVGMMAVDGKLYFMTPASTWKVRRLTHTPRVQVAVCTFGGKALGPVVDGVARRLTGPEAHWARKRICVGLFGWVVDRFYALRYPGDQTAVYEVKLATEG
jgi:PPOX class probable F420-dependent enzyme